MPRKEPMPESEQGICERLRRFRAATRLSQAEFASLVGLDARVFASYEYARSRLNYPAAWRILNVFRLLNPRWLAEGQGLAFELYFVNYPAPDETGLGPRAPFSVAYERFIKDPLLKAQSVWAVNPDADLPRLNFQPDIPGRLAAKDILNEMALDWAASQPDSHVGDFFNDLVHYAVHLLKKYPPDRTAEMKRRRTELFRAEAKRRMIFPLPHAESQKWVLTDFTLSSKSSPMKSELKNLMARLNRATHRSGMKGRLARDLGVPQSRVSEWLLEKKEPGGETTLRMLAWVSAFEAQQKESPARATTQAEPKTQLRKSSHENQTQVRKKR